MADVNANIGVNIDTSEALAQLKALQRQISQFHTSIAKSSESAAMAQRDLQKNFINSVNAIGSFSAELRTVKTTAESFTDSLEKNKFSMREYFRFAGGSTKTFGKLFKSEFDTIGKVAEDRVKKLQTQYIKLGRDTSGAMKAIAIMPNQLDMSNFSTQSQMAAQKQAIFNQLVKQGSTNLLNFGKNTQWAGRQLMVGFTLPLAALGATASRTFMEMEQATIKFRKVYGDLFTPETERQQALEDITALGQAFTQYGISVSQTVGLAAEAAAAGFAGVDLQRQTTEATRLSILGQVESQKALETTISLQNAFKMSSEDLASSIDFLNAVENQTVVSLDDITTAIPKVAPVIEQLGGDVKDLAFFMAAMKEGGINASEGANALKSGLAALINPTTKASAMLASYGININKIIEGNQGDLKTTVVEFAQALDTLDPLTRARAIEQLFGKFQFARLSTLFSNVINETGQASRVLDLAGTSIEDLAALSESELGITADSAMNKFRKSIEDLKFALVPVGQVFLEAITPLIEFAGGILEKFNNMSSGVKKALVVLTVGIGAIGPIALMTFGLLANGLANIIKGAMVLRNGYLRLTGQTQILGEQTEYLTMEQIEASAASASLDQAHSRLKQTFTAETGEVVKLIAAYQSATAAGLKFAAINPGMMRAPGAPTKRAKGKPVVVGGTGNQDTELALLTPGETVIPAEMSKRYGALINGMIAGNIPGYQNGKSTGKKVIMSGGMDVSHFGSNKQMSGADLLALFDGAEENIKNRVKALVSKFQDGSSRMFTVFDNQVVALFSDVNRDLDKKGSVSKERLKENLLGEKFAPVRDIELQRQFENAGKSPEAFKVANQQLTEAIERGFSKLGDVVDITEQQVNDLIETAYREVSETNADVKQAHEKMKQISTVTEPDVGSVRGKRVALGSESYVANKRGVKSYKNRMTSLVGKENIPYNLNSEFNISPASLQGLKLSGEEAARIFKKMSLEAQKGLAELKGNTNAFIKQFAIEAAKVGETIGVSATNAVGKAAQTQSPSKKTIKVGQDIARGLEIGMDSMQDDVAMSGQELGAAAVGGTQSGATKQRRIATRPAGPPTSVTNVASAPEVVKTKLSLDSMNRALMGSTFALTSLASAGSMASGPLGDISQQIMKYSGLLFALMSVTQLLTQAQFASLVANRAATAGLLTKTVTDTGTSFARVTGLFAGGIKELLPNLKRFGGMIARFAGIPGLVISAGIGIFSLVKMANKHREDERRAIMGLADAANMTSKKLATLGDIFGVKPGKNPLLQAAPSIRMTTERRGKVEEIKSSDAFQKDFADTISGLREATKKEAEIALKSISLSLSGQGYTKAMIADVVDALREEAGKTDVEIDLKSLDLGTAAGQEGFAKLAIDMTNELAVASKNGYEMQQVLVSGVAKTGQRYSYYADQLKPTVALQRAAAASGQTLFNMMTGLAGGLESGAINAKSFNQGFDQLEAQVNSFNAINPGSGLLMLKETIKLLLPETQKLFEGLEKDTDIMLMMRAQVLGLTYALPGLGEALKTINAGYQGNATELVIAQQRVKEYEKLILKTAKITEEEIKKLLGGGVKPGDTKKSAFQLAIEKLQEQQKELKNTSKAYDILKKSGVDAETALKYASDPVIALAIATGKVDPKNIKQIKKLMEGIEKSAGSAAIRDFLVALETENTLKKDFDKIIPRLMTMGATTKEIQDILENPMLMKSFIDKSATAEQIMERINKYLKGIRESNFVSAIKELQKEQGELENTQKAYDILKNAGVESGRAFEIASNSILAAAIATTEVGTEDWEKLLGVINKLNGELTKTNDQLAKRELAKFFETKTEQDELFKSFMTIVPELKKLGLGAEEIKAILSDPNLAKEFINDLKDGSLDAERLKTYLEQMPTEKNVNIFIEVETKTIEDKFEEAFRKAMEYFDNEIAKKKIELEVSLNIKGKKDAVDAAQKVVDEIQEGVFDSQGNVIKEGIDQVERQLALANRDIELNFDRPLEALQEEISDLQRDMEIRIERPIENFNKEIEKLERSIEEQFDRPIAILQEESSDLANDLTLMDKAAEAINERYDAQEEALQKISDINKDISNQKKQQIGLADALSRGDIAAAAQAAEEMRASRAEASANRAGSFLQGARKAELGGLLGSVSGLTRKQIEQRQFDIDQQIFALEERRDIVQDQIQRKQDEIFKLEQLKLPILEKIRIKEDEIYTLQEAREDHLLKVIRKLEDKLWKLQNVDLYEANKKLTAAQKALQDAENTINQEVEKIEAQKNAWEDAKVAIDSAKLAADGVTKAIEASTKELVNVAAGWAAVEAAAKKAAEAVSGASGVSLTAPKGETPEQKAAREAAAAKKIADAKAAEEAAAAKKIADAAKGIGVTPSALAAAESGAIGAVSIAVQIAAAQVAQAAADAARNLPNDGYLSNSGIGYRAKGGLINPMKFAMGGFAKGTDTVPTMLTPGEFVVNKKSAQKYGGLLNMINQNKAPQMLAKGGMVGGSGSPKIPSFGSPRNNSSSPSFGSPRNNSSSPSFGSLRNNLSSPSYKQNQRPMMSINRTSSSPTIADNSTSVYNYNVGINVGGSNINPDAIAKAVMNEIRYVDSQRIRGQRA